MSDGASAVGPLDRLSDEIALLVARALPCSAAISGMKKDFSEAAGSGFLFDDRGRLVTSSHVVAGLEPPLWVGLTDSPQVEASVLGVDRLTDVAVLQLAESPARHLRLRERPARLGELCLALGSPFGMYRESVSIGIVSGIGRSIALDERRPIENALQTDVAINPGNSGGPLIDVRGEVLGINMCLDRRAQDIGFAVPADTVGYAAREIILYGQVERAALGVAVAARVAESAGRRERRLTVTAVRDRIAGDLRIGDTLLRIAGREVTSRGDLFRLLSREWIGRPLDVEVLRDDRAVMLTLMPYRLGGPEEQQ